MRSFAKRIAVVGLVSGGVAMIVAACGSTAPRGEGEPGRSTEGLTVPSVLPYLDFDTNAPSASQIALTFDDGPDIDGNTASVLDTLKSKGVKASFFVNRTNYVDVPSSTTAQNLLKRMVNEGHVVGNHSWHHADFSLTSTDVDGELAGVDSMLHTYTPTFLNYRFVRAPYGNPFFGPQSRLDVVGPIIAHYGVHVGWNIDSLDWDCGDTSCVTNNVLNAVDSGQNGIILMHCVNPLTASVLPSLIDSLRSRGKTFITVESLVQSKYGDASRHLFVCSSNADCISTERCQSNGHCGGGSGGTDAGTDTGTTDTGKTDTGKTDTGTSTDTGSSDTGGGSTTTALCSAFTVTSGTIDGASTACSGTTPILAVNDTKILWYHASSSSTKGDGYATYHSPVDAAHIGSMTISVAYRGDNASAPLWYWYAQNMTTGAWELVGDNSGWSKSWSTSTHDFVVSSPSKYVAGDGTVRIRFTTTSSTNDAELNQMVLRIGSASGGTDAGTDTGSADTSIPDTSDAGVDSTVDSGTPDTGTPDTGTIDDTGTTFDSGTADTTPPSDATPVTEVIGCALFTPVSGSFYGASSTACSGTSPALLKADGTVVGWKASSSSTKANATTTYVVSGNPASVTAMSLLVTFEGDDKTEPLWTWSMQNVSTGVWEKIGDNSWAGNWTSTAHTFSIATPSKYVASDGSVRVQFTTTSSTNDAELDRMVLQVTH